MAEHGGTIGSFKVLIDTSALDVATEKAERLKALLAEIKAALGDPSPMTKEIDPADVPYAPVVITEIDDAEKTIELHGDSLIVSTHAENNYRTYVGFQIAEVKLPPGKRLVVVSDAPDDGAVKQPE